MLEWNRFVDGFTATNVGVGIVYVYMCRLVANAIRVIIHFQLLRVLRITREDNIKAGGWMKPVLGWIYCHRGDCSLLNWAHHGTALTQHSTRHMAQHTAHDGTALAARTAAGEGAEWGHCTAIRSRDVL